MAAEYIVTVKKGVDLNQFYNDMETPGGSSTIPDRQVHCCDRRPISRNTGYLLTEEEVDCLKNDSRVLDVISKEIANNIIIRPLWTQESNNWDKSFTLSNTQTNWGLYRCINGSQVNNWGSNATPSISGIVTTTTSGKDVDVAIIDGHLDPTHPEFALNVDGTGGTRVVQYNWLQHNSDLGLGVNGTYVYPTGNDLLNEDDNHGMHVAGTACGNVQGWAKESNIYNISPYDTNPNSIQYNMFDYVRAWHNNKSVNPSTGRTNPTIVNNSWGVYYVIPKSSITQIFYRGNTYTGPFTDTQLQNYGIVYFDSTNIIVSYPYSPLIADIEDAVDDGIIFVGSAGNDSTKIDSPGGIDYNNYIQYSGSDFYYHRGDVSSATRTSGERLSVCVGSISTLVNETKSTFSDCGPRVDVYAPGENIISCLHSSGGNTALVNDPRSSSYKLGKYSGTSMASPQVCGVLACLLEQYPDLTQAQVFEYLRQSSGFNQITDTEGGYTDFTSLQGSRNSYLKYSSVFSSVSLPGNNKSFGARNINLIGGESVPNITSDNDLNINAENVAISTNVSIGKSVTAAKFFGDGATIVGIVTQLVPGIGVDIFGTQDFSKGTGKGIVKVESYKPVGKTIYVAQNGNDRNTGLTENHPKRTIKSAVASALYGDTIRVYPGVYEEENPIVLNRTVSVQGTELRNCVITPKFPNKDIFYVNNGCHITNLSFIGPEMTNGAAVVALQKLQGVSDDRFFDGARMIRSNLDYIAKETVGFLTSGFSGFAGNHREQDAARLIDLNLDFIASEAVGFLTASVANGGYGFNLTGSNYTNCKEDIVSIMSAVSYDLKANSNRKSIGAGYSYFGSPGGLIHITGVGVSEATIAALDYAAGISTSIINNFIWASRPSGSIIDVDDVEYDNTTGITTIFATGHGLSENDIVKVQGIKFTCPPGSGITTDIYPDGREGFFFEVIDVINPNRFKIQVGTSTIPHSYDSEGTIQKYVNYQTQETQQFNSSVIKVPFGCVGVGTTVKQLVGIVTSMIAAGTTSVAPPVRYGVNLETDLCALDVKRIWKGINFDITRGGNFKSIKSGKSYYDENWNLLPGILKNPSEVEQTIAAIDYSFNIARSVVNNCTWGGYPAADSIGITTAEFDFTTGITTITAENHGLNQYDPVKIEGLKFECEKNSPGVSVDVVNAVYSHTTGIAIITTSEPLDIKSGNRIKLESLEFTCSDGGPTITGTFPSADGITVDPNYPNDFTVMDVIDSTTFRINVGVSPFPHTYVPNTGTAARVYTPEFSVDLATYDNTTGIATITVSGFVPTTDPGMYIEPGQTVKLDGLLFECNSGGGPSILPFPQPTSPYGNKFVVLATNDDRFLDAANLIELNRREIMDKSLAAIAISYPDFVFPNDYPTNRFSRFRDAYRLIQNNKTEIISSTLSVVSTLSGFQNPSDKCERDLGYFIDAISTDVFTGGNSYSIDFIKQYFDGTNLIGIDGEEGVTIIAFNKARDLMKEAITNQLTIKDLTLTPDPITGDNEDTNSCSNVQSAIDTLTSIVTTVISQGSLETICSVGYNTGMFVAGEMKCRRDIGYIVDALIKDIRYGTNKYIREATRAYFNANGTPISNGLVGEIAPSVTAFEAVGDYAKQAITNQLNKKDLTITVDPGNCSNVQSNIDTLIAILTTTITSGNLNNFPTLFASNKIKVNVGTSDFVHTYQGGGTVVANYTTNTFPDGTFGYIFPVHSVVGPNTFTFIGGKTVIPHAYMSEGTIQKYQNYQNEFTQVKDFGMQVDYETGFNNSINSCSNVISAIKSCVGVVTSIVGLGSTAFRSDKNPIGFVTTYPGNSGTGFETIYPICDVEYTESNGRTEIEAPGVNVKEGDLVEIRDLLFECDSGSGISTAIFPSGTFGYEFYVDEVKSNGRFVLNVGISTIPHTYVSGGVVVNRSVNISNAIYDNTTGLTTITAPGCKVRVGDLITIRDLEFACSSGAGTTTIYPTENKPFEVKAIYNSGETFEVNVGTSGIPHTYVSGGLIYPPYSRGVGPIVQGPYVRNCTNFIPKSIGMKVDGFDAEPGDEDDIGVTGTMSVDSYTQYNQGGIGVSITNGGYAQLVSIFTICNDTAIYTSSGGQCDLTNSNASFGNFGLYSKGVGDQTSKSIYRYTGIVKQDADAETDKLIITGVGTNRPYDGQALFFGELFYTVDRIIVTNGGSGYNFRNPPRVDISFPSGENGIRAEASPNIDENTGEITSIDVISSGSQYRLTDNIEVDIDPPVFPGGIQASAECILQPIYYNIESATLPVEGESTIVLTQFLNSKVGAGTTVYFSRLSLQIATTISFEWVGAGTNINTAKPALGGLTIKDNEVRKVDGGQVVFTSTNQAGNFRIGEGLTVNQLTGTITGRSFSQSLLNTVTPLIIALGK